MQSHKQDGWALLALTGGILIQDRPNDTAALVFAGKELSSLDSFRDGDRARRRFEDGLAYLESAMRRDPKDDDVAHHYCRALARARDFDVLTADAVVVSAQELLGRSHAPTQLCSAQAGLAAALEGSDWRAVPLFVEPLLNSADEDDRLLATFARGLLALENDDAELAGNILLTCAAMPENSSSRLWPHKVRPEWDLARKLATRGQQEVVAEYLGRYQQDGRHRPLEGPLLALGTK